jgi:hypothetical protein
MFSIIALPWYFCELLATRLWLKRAVKYPVASNSTDRMRLLHQFLTSDLGQDLIEYVLALALIIIVTTALMVSAGHSLSAVWEAPILGTANSATSTDLHHP